MNSEKKEKLLKERGTLIKLLEETRRKIKNYGDRKLINRITIIKFSNYSGDSSDKNLIRRYYSALWELANKKINQRVRHIDYIVYKQKPKNNKKDKTVRISANWGTTMPSDTTSSYELFDVNLTSPPATLRTYIPPPPYFNPVTVRESTESLLTDAGIEVEEEEAEQYYNDDDEDEEH